MQKDDNNPWKLVSFALELGFLITIPLIALALLGRFVDAALRSSPLFFLLAVILSIVISSVIVIKKVSVLIGDAEKGNLDSRVIRQLADENDIQKPKN